MDCVDTGRDFWPAAMRPCRKPGIRQRGQRPRWRARVKWLHTLTCLRSNPLESGSSCSTGELPKAEVSNSVPQLEAVEEVYRQPGGASRERSSSAGANSQTK